MPRLSGVQRSPSLPIACLAAAGLCILLATAQEAMAEPYLAVQEGVKCMVCHTSPSGGGKRTAFGNVYALIRLPERYFKWSDKTSIYWTGELWKILAIGGDVRGGWKQVRTPGQPGQSGSELEEILGYVEVRLLPGYLTFYLDKRLRPDQAFEREKYVRLSTKNGRFYIKGGDMFLPYGLRLQDDSAFIRRIPGINYNTPDTGWEAGLEYNSWSAQLAVSRGTAGGPEIDSGKQYSLRVSYVRPKWRVGGSFNLNDTDFGDRQMQNIFAGLKTGRIAWLAEFDYIIDEGTPTGRREFWTSFLEANFAVKQGHNLKLTAEYFDPDIDVSENGENRLSFVWEYFPVQFVQTRLGYRRFDGIPQNATQNRDELFLELHVPF